MHGGSQPKYEKMIKGCPRGLLYISICLFLELAMENFDDEDDWNSDNFLPNSLKLHTEVILNL